MLTKCIGLLNIFANGKGIIDKQFLVKYAKLALNITNASEVIESLERHKIIKYANHKSQYIFVEGTDLDIDLKIYEAGSIIQKSKDITEKIKNYIELNYIPARAYYFETGTPRFFEYCITHKPLNEVPIGEVEGFVNLIFNENLIEKDIVKHSEQCTEAILFVWYKNTNEIIDCIFEIDKINYVIENTDKADRIAIDELQNLKNIEVKKLNQLIIENLFSDTDLIKWLYKGETIEVKNKTQFNKFLSKICFDTYNQTPVFKNEMVNKHKISSAITLARKNLSAYLY